MLARLLDLRWWILVFVGIYVAAGAVAVAHLAIYQIIAMWCDCSDPVRVIQP